jgi:hypothetical protein
MKIAADWFHANLLTLNSKKTKFLCFHKTASSKPSFNPVIKIHTCNSLPNNSCDCNSIQRTDVIKYLGLFVDENLNFKHHIRKLSARIRKSIGIFKKLRHSADHSLLVMVYVTLCQSVISYCITVWGCATKTIMLEIERAQRSVLKVMLKKPFRFPTTALYSHANVLTVRQLFLLKLSLTTHKSSKSLSCYNTLLAKRVFSLPVPRVCSTYGNRFGEYVRVSTYNSILKHCDLKDITINEAKKQIFKLLHSLNYAETEDILENIL